MKRDFEIERGQLFGLLKNWLNLNADVESAAAIYAIAGVLQDRLDRIDLTEEQKGGILEDLFRGFREDNKAEIALFLDLKKYMDDGKHCTKH
jgi:hypothetical protein